MANDLEAALAKVPYGGDARSHTEILRYIRQAFRAYHGEEKPKYQGPCMACTNAVLGDDYWRTLGGQPIHAKCIRPGCTPYKQAANPEPKIEVGAEVSYAAERNTGHRVIAVQNGVAWCRGKTGNNLIASVGQFRVTKAAVPECGDYVQFRGGVRGYLFSIDHKNRPISPYSVIAGLREGAWYSREEFTIIAKANHTEAQHAD